LKPLHKYILYLILLFFLIAGMAFFLVSTGTLILSFCDISILSLLFSIITLTTITVFFRGQSKEPDKRIFYSMISISLKLLLEMILALVWFYLAKKTSIPSVLMFFVLYLSFTLFSIWVILGTVKNKSL